MQQIDIQYNTKLLLLFTLEIEDTIAEEKIQRTRRELLPDQQRFLLVSIVVGRWTYTF